MSSVISSFHQLLSVAGAFLSVGARRAFSYPLSFAMSQLTSVVPVFVYFFVARLVGDDGSGVAGDYYTFVVIGIVAQRILAAGLRGVGEEIESAVEEGRFEGLLVQPVPWRMLPFGMAQWPMAWRFINVFAVVTIAVALGASFRLAGIPLALLVVALGALATMSVGVVAGAAKVLAKGTDPVLTIYSIAVMVLAGVFYPIDMLPAPLRALSYLLPDTYVILALRKLLMADGASVGGPSPLVAVVGLAMFTAVVLPLGLWLFGQALNYGRRIGVLGGY